MLRLDHSYIWAYPDVCNHDNCASQATKVLFGQVLMCGDSCSVVFPKCRSKSNTITICELLWSRSNSSLAAELLNSTSLHGLDAAESPIKSWAHKLYNVMNEKTQLPTAIRTCPCTLHADLRIERAAWLRISEIKVRKGPDLANGWARHFLRPECFLDGLTEQTIVSSSSHANEFLSESEKQAGL